MISLKFIESGLGSRDFYLQNKHWKSNVSIVNSLEWFCGLVGISVVLRTLGSGLLGFFSPSWSFPFNMQLQNKKLTLLPICKWIENFLNETDSEIAKWSCRFTFRLKIHSIRHWKSPKNPFMSTSGWAVSLNLMNKFHFPFILFFSFQRYSHQFTQ